jgi:hypothetical protein
LLFYYKSKYTKEFKSQNVWSGLISVYNNNPVHHNSESALACSTGETMDINLTQSPSLSPTTRFGFGDPLYPPGEDRSGGGGSPPIEPWVQFTLIFLGCFIVFAPMMHYGLAYIYRTNAYDQFEDVEFVTITRSDTASESSFDEEDL